MTTDVLLYEGKAKKIYQTNQSDVLRIAYKDSATAFNGEKKATIQGKGRLNNEISAIIFKKLAESGIQSHFIEKISETEQLVKAVTIIPLEVVVRNIIAGSLAKRLGLEEGIEASQPIVEFYYKQDELGDPLINEDHVKYMNLATGEELQFIRESALQINHVLIDYFKKRHIKLIDFKLEFGRLPDGAIILADEISPDTCRLWDDQTNQKLDKDVFRRDLGNLTDAYDELLQRMGD